MKQWLLNLVIKHVFNGFVLGDMLTYNKTGKAFFINGRQLEEAEVKILREESEYIKRTELWKHLESFLNRKAQSLMVTESKNWDDVFFGKAMVYVLAVINDFFKAFVDLKK